MTTAQASESTNIPAPAAAIYTVLADYRNHHPHILPTQYFRDFVVEEGGQGAGTVFRTAVHVFGSKSTNHMIVSEPQPGRVLKEADLETGLVTTFTVTPVADGQQSKVELKTIWPRKAGLAGQFEAWMTGQVMRMIYRKELGLLAAYMKRLSGKAGG